MYRINPVVEDTDDDIVHTDNMYKMSVAGQPIPTASTTGPTDQFSRFLVNKSGARSKLGQALETMGQQQGCKHVESDQRAEKQTSKAALNTEVSNEMNLDKYIVRKVAPVSKLGKHLQSQQEGENRSDHDLEFLHRLKEMEQMLDGFLVPMGLVKSSDHISSSLLTDSKVPEPPAQPTKRVEKPTTAPISTLMTNSIPSPAPPPGGHTGDCSRVVHPLHGLDQVLDSLFAPMSPVKSGEHASSSLLGGSKVAEPPAQPTKHVENPTAAPTSAPSTNLVPSLTSPSGVQIDDDPKLIHRLKEMEQLLDGFLVPMGLVKSGEHASFLLTGSKVPEPPAQPAERIEKPTSAPTTNQMSSLISPSGGQIDDDPKLIHRLKEMEQLLDSFLVPMGLVRSGGHASSSLLTDNIVPEPLAQPTKHVEEPTTAPISAPMNNLVSFLPPTFVDLALHCDPRTPPFAILLYSKMLKLGGHDVSLQFYKHSSLMSIPEHLPQLEKFFTDQPRSSASKLILSVIWRPCALGCMAVSNPFTDLPLYGESAILMFLSSLSPDFARSFGNLSRIDSAVLTKNEEVLMNCIEKFGKRGSEPFSIEELSLFISCEVAGLSSLIQRASNSWFSRCMSNECFATTKKMIDQYH
ncbi:hypothetical protein ECG_02030 [Echinococcus granulosus]|uniref:AIMP2 thioredoxin-like domain-containing protein n=1 Tax=Echinococcus granulosus TaxID=6210 RepID=W6UL47_ECHGR|nr:hypothetical protein EGR_03144 [Echinococcus granulosus]EUB61871.1 hypothetical protein EGR_03144 [Echinococcus granulosus]KAH9286021.1 hypothetical protein ECG_02030 [Echinococcus granulosus]